MKAHLQKTPKRVRLPLHKIAALAAAITLVLLAAGCTRLFFNPSKRIISNSAVLSYSPQDVYMKSADGLTLHGWFFQAREARGTILVCHGNVENMSTHAKLDLWLIDAGYNIFIFDYRGYGRSEGAPDVLGVHLDAEAALETLLFRLPHDSRHRIFIFGKSLGAAVAVYTVSRSPYKNRLKALILDSPFSSYRAIAREKIAESIVGWPFQYPLSYLVNDDYSPIKYIQNVAPVPVVIIHGAGDPVIPEHHGRILYETALQPKQLWETAIPGHVTAQEDDAVRKRLLAFLSGVP